MICYVDIEHDKVLNDPAKRKDHLARRAEAQLRLEAISGQPCLVQRYPRVTRNRLHEWGIRAVVISGNATDWEHYDERTFDAMYEIIRAAELPILGICGGCQLIAMAHGGPVGPIRRLREGEQPTTATSVPGYFKEHGFTPVRVIKSDPLFAGLGERPVFLEAHYWEIKQPPAGFDILASTDETPVQAIRQANLPIYAVQFHPEGYTEGAGDDHNPLADIVYPDSPPRGRTDGRTLLRNFFRIAEIVD